MRFAITGLAALGLLSFAAIELLQSQGTDEAIRNAKELTELAGRSVVAPPHHARRAGGQADGAPKP